MVSRLRWLVQTTTPLVFLSRTTGARLVATHLSEVWCLGSKLTGNLLADPPGIEGFDVVRDKIRSLGGQVVDLFFRKRAFATVNLHKRDQARQRTARARIASATVVRELNTVSHAIEIATREWGLWEPRNPVKLVRRPPVPRGRTRRFKEGEEQSLLDACEHGRSPLLRPLIILAIETAMRRGELLSLRWENVELKLRVAHLPLTKNGDSRDVPLSRRAVQTLEVIHAGGVAGSRLARRR
jgi:integrase